MAVRMRHIRSLIEARPRLFEGRSDAVLARAEEVAAKDSGYISSALLPDLIGQQATDQLFADWEAIPDFAHDPPLNDNEEQLVADFGCDFCEQRRDGNGSRKGGSRIVIGITSGGGS
jgi:hypothetical protein